MQLEHMIYMDHAATTPTDERVADAMEPWVREQYGNPSTLYTIGGYAARAIEEARVTIAEFLGAQPDEIFFTSGGTEADNWAIKGAADAHRKKGRHLITTTIEHHAVLDTMEFLEKRDYEVTRVPVDSRGIVDPEDIRKALREDTILVSVMHGNNEVGSIQPIAEISQVLKDSGALFHTDAVQSVGKIPVDVDQLGMDLLSLSGHKIYGPKGVGALYIRKRTRITPLLHGGGQERRRRAGTQNVPGIIGLAKAIELAAEYLDTEAERERRLVDRLWKGLEERIPDLAVNGPQNSDERLPGMINFRVEGIEGEAMILCLDMNRVGVSSGSACTTGSLDPSHVLLAMGIPAELAHGSLRISLGRDNTETDVDYFVDVFAPVVRRLRDMSPVYDK